MMIPVSPAHPLRERLIKAGITLWQLQQMLGGKPSESRLSYFLTGKRYMPERLRVRIEAALMEVGA